MPNSETITNYNKIIVDNNTRQANIVGKCAFGKRLSGKCVDFFKNFFFQFPTSTY
jgi:hypothetical protein